MVKKLILLIAATSLFLGCSKLAEEQHDDEWKDRIVNKGERIWVCNRKIPAGIFSSGSTFDECYSIPLKELLNES